MDAAEFQAIWNANDGWNNCQFLHFDNMRTWIFDRKKYHKVYEEEKDEHGIVISRKRIYNSPLACLDADGNVEYEDLHNYLTINPTLSTVERILWFTGVTADEILDGNCKKYTKEVTPIENIQDMGFRDDNNKDTHIDLPPAMF